MIAQKHLLLVIFGRKVCSLFCIPINLVAQLLDHDDSGKKDLTTDFIVVQLVM